MMKCSQEIVKEIKYNRGEEVIENIWKTHKQITIATDGGLKEQIGSYAAVFTDDRDDIFLECYGAEVSKRHKLTSTNLNIKRPK